MRGASTAERMEIIEIVQALASCDAVDDVVRVLASATRTHVGADGATVVMRDGDRSRYLEEDAIGALWKGRDFPLDECISGWAMRNGEQVVVPDVREDPRIPQRLYEATFVRSLVMTPIECAGEIVGALGAYWSETRTPTPVECRTLQAIADSAALALVNVRLLAEIRSDERRKERFLDGLANELSALVGPLRTSLHTREVFGRYGGEEFLVLFPDTSLDQARQSAERLRVSLREQRLRVDDQDVTVTISLGIASYESGDVLFDQIARRADIALYVAKTQGRDRCEIFNPARHGTLATSASSQRQR